MTLPETITLYVVREAGPVKHWTWSFDLDYTYDKYGDRQYLQETMEDPLETIHVFGLVGIPHFDVGKQQDALAVTTDILALAGFDRNKYSVCLDITRAPQIYIEVLFDAVDETRTFVQKVSEGMRKVFEVLFVDHQVPGNVGVIIDGQNYPWVDGRIER